MLTRLSIKKANILYEPATKQKTIACILEKRFSDLKFLDA